MKTTVKTIDVNTKEWFDRTYGNSYFSAQVTINYGMDNEETIYIPFQYGYGSHSENVAMKKVEEKYPELKGYSIWQLKENGIIYRYSKKENCLKREVKLFAGKDY